MIPFNIPPYVETADQYFKVAIANHKICGDGEFTRKCSSWFEKQTGAQKVLLTTSCTHALEMSALLCKIEPGDEVIMPSYTFVSTADAFVARGACIVFVDIRPDTMNIDEELIEDAITNKTKAIVVVHYAGVACEMDKIADIAKHYNLYLIEDAAQGVNAYYKGRALGTIGDMGCYSFHETKNYSMGEGGAIVLNNKSFIESAEIIREKGTNRSKFFRGQIDKYTWVDFGSSYLPSELNASYLWSQLEVADEINQKRLQIWDYYFQNLQSLSIKHLIDLPYVPGECTHNAHMFYIKVADVTERDDLISFLKQNEILAVFHYVPLHSSPAGIKYGRFHGENNYTTSESDRLLRLPLFYGISVDQAELVVNTIYQFFSNRG
jgi:dTDP-4-amino-4,6-dideoxygalactose transaminase